MQRPYRAACAIALASACVPALAATATATRAWEYKPESNAGLKLRNFIGNVRVERGSRPGIHVTATTAVPPASRISWTRSLMRSGSTGAAYSSRRRATATSPSASASSASSAVGSSWRVQSPSRCSAPAPPSRLISIAVAGLVTPSIAAAMTGMSNW